MKTLLRFTLLVLFTACAVEASAQSANRAGKWEFTLQPQYTHSQSFDTGHGSGAQVDSSLGFGIGVAYNLSNALSIGGEFTWGTASYVATIAAADGSGTTTTAQGTLISNTFRLNATWNILPGDFTPLLQGGIGSTYIDTNIPTAPPQNTCWWDPWWGYYCGTYYPTRTAYYVSYMVGAGLRWELDRSIFVRAMANRQWLDAGGSLGTPWTDQYRVDLGFKF
jgi:opacity protein-like surface antigen